MVQQKELAVEFSIKSELNFEDFRCYRNPDNFKSNPFQIPGHISFLFDGIPITVDKEDFKSPDLKVYINPLIDDRMFVICWYGNDELINEFMANDKDHCRDEKGHLVYQESDWWYKFIFNDQKDATCQNKNEEEINQETYL